MHIKEVMQRVQVLMSHLAPDQLKYLDVIPPQDERRTSVVSFTINNTAIVVGKATFENINRRTLVMLSL